MLCCLENGSVSVHNVGTNVDGTYTDVCGYAEVPDLAVPGTLLVGLTSLFIRSFFLLPSSCLSQHWPALKLSLFDSG